MATAEIDAARQRAERTSGLVSCCLAKIYSCTPNPSLECHRALVSGDVATRTTAKLLRLLQLRCSPTATSFFHSQKVVLKNTGLLSSAAHAQCSLSNQNDCSRCAGALFASAGSSE